ncbi:MAG: hypothetical protein K6F59_04670 [Gammaproteobacteria bacterium]|nr:hypothetical protein [Gammaproteobacteria bacterium]
MNKTKLASIGLISASLILIASVTTTAAWFVGLSQLGLGCIDVHIGTKNVEIRTDDGEFKTELNKSDLAQVDYFIPCTSAFSHTWMDVQASSPIFRSAYTECVSQFMTNESFAPVAAKGYFAQDLYIKTSSDSYVLVDPKETIFEPDYVRNAQKAEQLAGKSGKTKAQIESELNSIVKSMRIAILSLEYYDASNNLDPSLPYDYKFAIFDCYKFENYGEANQKENKTYLGGIMDVDADGYFDAISNKEVLYGEVYNTDKTEYDDPTGEDSLLRGESTCFNAKHNGFVETFNYEKSAANGLEIATENSIGIQEADKKFAMKMYAGKQRKFVLCFYLEGWDLDNTNLTMYAAFKLRISFMAQDGLNY